MDPPKAPARAGQALDLPHLCRPFHREPPTALPRQPRPRQTGLSGRLRPSDPDRLRPRPRARQGEVGKVGVPIAISVTCAALRGIPLVTMNTSMTINATAAWLLALYAAVADEQGPASRRAAGHHAERHHQGIPVARHLCVSARHPLMRLVKDVILSTTADAEIKFDLLLPTTCRKPARRRRRREPTRSPPPSPCSTTVKASGDVHGRGVRRGGWPGSRSS